MAKKNTKAPAAAAGPPVHHITSIYEPEGDPRRPLRPAETWQDFFMGRHFASLLVPPALLVVDAVLCVYILSQVPYTEIDWVAYMEQVAQFVGGERDYTQMEGGTGPLVYPAAHVYTYTFLYNLTNQGTNILLAQFLFAGFYLGTLSLVLFCYWRAGAPTYMFPILILSKRLHSIFILRCFNDGVAAFCLWAAIFLFQCRQWSLGLLVYAWGLGTKMTLLLSLPAVVIVLFVGRGFKGALALVALLVQFQVVIALPFLGTNASGYFGRAFELSRQFMYRWTVNWRFVDEETFLSRPFALGLLAVHVSLLVLFITTRWLRPISRATSASATTPFAPIANLVSLVTPMLSFRSPLTKEEEIILSARAGNPRYITTAILTANLLGMLTARSLHYQFFVYIAWTTPFLLWRSGAHPIVQYALWAAQEWAWNVYPSTPVSSGVVIGTMTITVAYVYFGNQDEFDPALPPAKVDAKKKM